MKHKIEIAPNDAIYIDGKRVVSGKPFGLFATKTIVVASDDLAEIAKRCNELLEQKEADDDYERAVEQMEYDMLYEPTYNPEDGSI